MKFNHECSIKNYNNIIKDIYNNYGSKQYIRNLLNKISKKNYKSISDKLKNKKVLFYNKLYLIDLADCIFDTFIINGNSECMYDVKDLIFKDLILFFKNNEPFRLTLINNCKCKYYSSCENRVNEINIILDDYNNIKYNIKKLQFMKVNCNENNWLEYCQDELFKPYKGIEDYIDFREVYGEIMKDYNTRKNKFENENDIDDLENNKYIIKQEYKNNIILLIYLYKYGIIDLKIIKLVLKNIEENIEIYTEKEMDSYDQFMFIVYLECLKEFLNEKYKIEEINDFINIKLIKNTFSIDLKCENFKRIKVLYQMENII